MIDEFYKWRSRREVRSIKSIHIKTVWSLQFLDTLGLKATANSKSEKKDIDILQVYTQTYRIITECLYFFNPNQNQCRTADGQLEKKKKNNSGSVTGWSSTSPLYKFITNFEWAHGNWRPPERDIKRAARSRTQMQVLQLTQKKQYSQHMILYDTVRGREAASGRDIETHSEE